jgi:transposase
MGESSQALGRSRGGFSTKVHVSVDARCNPLRFRLSAGHRHDITEAEALMSSYSSKYVIADKGYDSDEFIQLIK